jgi:alpha-glucosidase (family GH31 glycosyl hydrolase)
MRTILLILLSFILFHPASSQPLHRLEVHLAADTAWWAGVVNHGHRMPVAGGYRIDLNGNLYGNQAQPLMLSDRGHVIWSDGPFTLDVGERVMTLQGAAPFVFRRAGHTLREAFLDAGRMFFPPTGTMPDARLFSAPQYNTWIELMYDQNQEDILAYARAIVANGLPPGVLMIDDNWQDNYGQWTFHPGRFSDPKAMIDELHELGFAVMMWVCPFVSADSPVYRELEREGYLLLDETSRPAIVRWWNGASALLDLSNPMAVAWFTDMLDHLVDHYGVDGFKLDGGDAEYYVGTRGYADIGPNEHARLFGTVGLRYPLNEYRAMWKMGGQPIANRLRDKAHHWDDLNLLVPHILLQGLSGYAFTCPDMIGGGEYGSFLQLDEIDQELIVRWTQASALMPMMQFSVAPWRILDDDHFGLVKDAVEQRQRYAEFFLELAAESAVSGEPMVRSLEYVFPQLGYRDVSDQFLLGDRLLVAPVLEKGVVSRTVEIPPGLWLAADGSVYSGPSTIEVRAPLRTLPVFERISE